MKGSESRMISRQEAAEILRVDPQTITNWCGKGVLRAKQVGKWLMVDRDTITKLFDSLQDLAESEKVIKDLQQKNYEMVHKLRQANDQWMLDVAMVNGMERPSRLIRMIHTMIDCVDNEIMSERERSVLKEYLDGSEFEAIGDEYGITRERTRQIIEKGMRKLGSLEPYGDVLNRCNEAESENKMMRNLLKKQEAELAELRDKLNIKVEHDKHKTAEEKAMDELSEQDKEILGILNTRLVDMNLTVRSLNCLKAADLETFGDLVKCKKIDLLKQRNFGKKSLGELDDLLDTMSNVHGVRFYFGMNVDEYYDRFTRGIIANS